MTWFGQGHSKWVNTGLKHITAPRHSCRGERSEVQKGVRQNIGRELEEKEGKDNERNLKAIPFIMPMTL